MGNTKGGTGGWVFVFLLIVVVKIHDNILWKKLNSIGYFLKFTYYMSKMVINYTLIVGNKPDNTIGMPSGMQHIDSVTYLRHEHKNTLPEIRKYF